MAGKMKETLRLGDGFRPESIDSDTADRIDTYLARALAAQEAEQTDFHLRHARQILQAARE